MKELVSDNDRGHLPSWAEISNVHVSLWPNVKSVQNQEQKWETFLSSSDSGKVFWDHHSRSAEYRLLLGCCNQKSLSDFSALKQGTVLQEQGGSAPSAFGTGTVTPGVVLSILMAAFTKCY